MYRICQLLLQHLSASNAPADIFFHSQEAAIIFHYAGRLLCKPENGVNPVHLKGLKKIQINNGFYVALFLQIGCYCAIFDNSVL